MLINRIITALIGIPLVIATVFSGELFALALLVVAILALNEWLILTKNIYRSYPLAAFTSMLGIILSAYYGNFGAMFTALILSLFFTLIVMLRYYPDVDIGGLMLSYFGAVYSGIAISSVYLLRQQWGVWAVVGLLTLIWVTDSGAYFIGRTWGNRKLAPQISPKKTWGGFFGGLGSALAVGMVFTSLWQISLLHMFFLSLLISLAGQLGDLIESALKRSAGVKDSGNLLPGHGGMLDRIDSLLMAAPIAYIFLYWLIID
ncbi:phosphatidate cytidylyltransferase [Metallumcola ferriviriculae]|uniref:Phosphatidate cytidylyltransferase n=1 Tax=Metallumcola ferriviriculae TaxID=3039180 RepID=A0AAU0ULM4_9FIRM|nr:phosphatidate cytidylyltransferase [Desulfitibacteraceae bacterium MK1]